MIYFDFFEPIKRFLGKGTWTVSDRNSLRYQPDQKSFWYYFNEYYFIFFVPVNFIMLGILLAYGTNPGTIIIEYAFFASATLPLALFILFGIYFKKFNLSAHRVTDWWWIVTKSVRAPVEEVFGKGILPSDVMLIVIEARERGIKCSLAIISGFMYVDNEKNLMYLKLTYFK